MAPATAVSDQRRLTAAGGIVNWLVQPGAGDRLMALFARTAADRHLRQPLRA